MRLPFLVDDFLVLKGLIQVLDQEVFIREVFGLEEREQISPQNLAIFVEDFGRLLQKLDLRLSLGSHLFQGQFFIIQAVELPVKEGLEELERIDEVAGDEDFVVCFEGEFGEDLLDLLNSSEQLESLHQELFQGLIAGVDIAGQNFNDVRYESFIGEIHFVEIQLTDHLGVQVLYGLFRGSGVEGFQKAID